MVNEPVETLSITESGNTIWVKDGLPPLTEGGALAEIPNDPHTFVVNRLKFIDSDGKQIVTKNGVRVILGHGTYNTEEHSLKFLSGQKVSETVLTYNEEHPDDPIQMVVACSGNQTPINTDDPNKNPEDNAYQGVFDMNQGVAYSITTDLEVLLIREEDNTVNMDIKQKNPEGGFIFIENIKDTGSQIEIS
ncbi:hypothetical protein HYT02_04300 [Candidatus Gottesmanbacteria bacterium]|nr:hypothetical protein [Candidatus Gottesmanbacteria bacterium]